MEKFKFWYLVNQSKITWFLIGWSGSQALQSFSQGNWVGTIVNLVFIWLMLVLPK